MRSLLSISTLILSMIATMVITIVPVKGLLNKAPSHPVLHLNQPTKGVTKFPTLQKKLWHLIFNSVFSGKSINLHKWSIISGRWKWNNELETYEASSLRVDHGLHIESNYTKGIYTSGAINTQHTFSFTYGKVIVKAKLPSGKGIFPAIWLRPYTTGVYPEIDIMENIGSEPGEVWQVFHFIKKGGKIGDLYASNRLNPNEFNTFELNWSPGSLVWEINGKEVFHVSNAYVPSQPMYLFLNTAIGGNWPGSPKLSIFPQTFDIQYVKVYQSKRRRLG